MISGVSTFFVNLSRCRTILPQKYEQSVFFSQKTCICQKKVVPLHPNTKTCTLIKDDVIIRYSTPEEYHAAFQGMLNAKHEWLAHVKQRERELGIN